eukprot:COSAG05_NODE_512_length_9090_cov_33.937827_9_plen_102_part_00
MRDGKERRLRGDVLVHTVRERDAVVVVGPSAVLSFPPVVLGTCIKWWRQLLDLELLVTHSYSRHIYRSDQLSNCPFHLRFEEGLRDEQLVVGRHQHFLRQH